MRIDLTEDVGNGDFLISNIFQNVIEIEQNEEEKEDILLNMDFVTPMKNVNKTRKRRTMTNYIPPSTLRNPNRKLSLTTPKKRARIQEQPSRKQQSINVKNMRSCSFIDTTQIRNRMMNKMKPKSYDLSLMENNNEWVSNHWLVFARYSLNPQLNILKGFHILIKGKDLPNGAFQQVFHFI